MVIASLIYYITNIMENQILKLISLKIFEVMEDIGVTEEMVNFRRYIFLQHEVRLPLDDLSSKYTNPVWNEAENAVYEFGSQVEGSTTLGMNSDHDMMYVSPFLKVILQGPKAEISEGARIEALVVKDETCCCFLQVGPMDPKTEPTFALAMNTFDMTGQIFRDSQGRLFVLNQPVVDNFASLLTPEPECIVQHGPALMRSGIEEYTFALYCPSLPDDCQVLFTRPKPGHWPKQQTLSKAKQCGMFIVHPGNMGSTFDCRNLILTIKFSFVSSQIQWRMSTNLIERLLMFDLNIVQMSAYILTKMIRKEFLSHPAENRLSTFHMKTSLLFTIEQFPDKIWKKDNLVQCVLYCLNTLRRFLKRRFCPHYTIASVNLFENKLEVWEMNHLENNVLGLINAKLRCVEILRMDKFGKRLFMKKYGRYGIKSQLSTKEEKRSQIICENFLNINRSQSCYINRVATQSGNKLDTWLNDTIQLESFFLENDIKYRLERKYKLNDFLSQKASVYASRCIEKNSVIPEDIDEMFRVSLSSENISCYLKYASMLVCTQRKEKAALLLNDLSITTDMIEVSPFLRDSKKFRKRAKITSSNSPSEIVKDCLRKIVTPVSFSREESHCLPKHLVYEMYRRDIDKYKKVIMYFEPIHKRWRDTAVINVRPFLFYLQYLSSSNTHTKHVSLCNIEKYLKDKLNGRDNFDKHIETTINILGHMYELENNISAAWTTYAKSVLYVPIDNAALWHLFRLLGQHVYG